jgi:hypothetical protein
LHQLPLSSQGYLLNPGKRHRNITKKNSQPLPEFPVPLRRKRSTFEAKQYLPIILQNNLELLYFRVLFEDMIPENAIDRFSVRQFQQASETAL